MSQNSDVRAKIATRGSRAPVPKWWISAARRRVRSQRLSLQALGEQLAEVAERDQPWSYVSLIRFFDGKPTAEIADAFLRLFPELPEYVYYPRSMAEARAFASIRDAIDEKARRPLLRAIDRRAGVARRR